MFIAEREGFEPPVPLSTTVFKTVVIDTTLPSLLKSESIFDRKASAKVRSFFFPSKFFTYFLHLFVILRYYAAQQTIQPRDAKCGGTRRVFRNTLIASALQKGTFYGLKDALSGRKTWHFASSFAAYNIVPAAIGLWGMAHLDAYMLCNDAQNE